MPPDSGGCLSALLLSSDSRYVARTDRSKKAHSPAARQLSTRPGCGSRNAPAPPSGRAAGRRLSAGPPEGPRSARPSADRRPDKPGGLRAAREKTPARAGHACASPTSDRRPRRRTSATSDGFQLPRLQELLFFKEYPVIKNPFPITNDTYLRRISFVR